MFHILPLLAWLLFVFAIFVCFHFRSHFVSLLFLRFVLVCLLFLVELSRRLIFSIFYLSSSPSRFLQSFNERGGGRVSPLSH